MPPLLLDRHEAAVDELGEMGACSLRGHAGAISQFPGRQRAAVNQGDQHRGAGRIGDERGGLGDARQMRHGRFLNYRADRNPVLRDARCADSPRDEDFW